MRGGSVSSVNMSDAVAGSQRVAQTGQHWWVQHREDEPLPGCNIPFHYAVQCEALDGTLLPAPLCKLLCIPQGSKWGRENSPVPVPVPVPQVASCAETPVMAAEGDLAQNQANGVPAASHAEAFLLAPDVLGSVLRAAPAGQASICALHAFKLVCKIWLAVARQVLADAQWLTPFVEAAESFLLQIPLLQAQLDGMHDDDEDEHSELMQHISTSLVLGMRAYRSHGRVQEAGCTALAELAGDDDNTAAFVGTALVCAGAVRAVVEAMTGHMGDVAVQEKGCKAIANFPHNTDTADDITGAGGVITVMATMSAHVRHLGLQAAGCWALQWLCRNHAAELGEGGIIVVVEAMKAHPLDADLQFEGCVVLAMLAANANNLTTIAGIRVVVVAMTAHIRHSGVQQFGCMVLAQFSDPFANVDESHTIAIAGAGGIGVVVLAAMTAHTWDLVVQENGCKVLRNLASNHAENIGITGAGGIRVVVVAMTAHSQAVVQEVGCGVLATLSLHSGNRILDVVAMITDAGGIRVVGAAMKAHTGHAALQENGCAVLNNLCAIADNKVEVAGVGGIGLVLAAMTAHVGHVDMQVVCCVTLGNLARRQAENQKKVAKAGGISLVVAAMAAHSKNVDMQEAGCMALSNLGVSGRLLKYIKKEGGIGVLEAAVVATGSTAGCQKLGQKLLDKLAKVSLAS